MEGFKKNRKSSQAECCPQSHFLIKSNLTARGTREYNNASHITHHMACCHLQGPLHNQNIKLNMLSLWLTRPPLAEINSSSTGSNNQNYSTKEKLQVFAFPYGTKECVVYNEKGNFT